MIKIGRKIYVNACPNCKERGFKGSVTKQVFGHDVELHCMLCPWKQILPLNRASEAIV